MQTAAHSEMAHAERVPASCGPDPKGQMRAYAYGLKIHGESSALSIQLFPPRLLQLRLFCIPPGQGPALDSRRIQLFTPGTGPHLAACEAVTTALLNILWRRSNADDFTLTRSYGRHAV
jgi:hypothetical protein